MTLDLSPGRSRESKDPGISGVYKVDFVWNDMMDLEPIVSQYWLTYYLV